MFVPFAIRAQRPIVINTAYHIRPMTGHDLAVSGLLKIENVKSIRWAADDFGRLLGLLRQANSFEERGDAAKRGDIGACGQKFQKLTTGGERGYGLCHNGGYGNAGKALTPVIT